jgi:type I restriction enzyme, S subunit
MRDRVAEDEVEPWATAKLGDVASCTLGGTPSTEVPQFWGGRIPWMASGDVHLRRVQDVPGRITAAGLAASNATLVPPPAVAVGLAGQGKTRGTVALTLCELSTNQSIALLRGDEIRLQTAYLFHNLDRRYEELRARSSGGGRGGLSKGILDAVPIDLPPLPEQRAITEILDTLDTTIRQTEAIIEKLKQVKQGLLHDLLTRGIDANGELRPPQNQAPHLYKDSPLGWIPREWTALPIASLVRHVTYGFTNPMPTTTEGPWMLTAADIADGRVNYSTARRTDRREFVRLSRKSRPSKGDILVTKDGTLGRVALLDREDVCVNQSVAVLSPFEPGPGAFLALYLRSQPGQDRMIADAGGSTIKHIYITTLAEMLVPGPPTIEAYETGRRAEALEQRIQLEDSALHKLGTLKSGLMDDLLTGRVRVTPLLDAAALA